MKFQKSELNFIRRLSIFYALPDSVLDSLKTLLDYEEHQKIISILNNYDVPKDEYGFPNDPLMLLGLDLIVWINIYFNYEKSLPIEIKKRAKTLEGYNDLNPDTNFLLNNNNTEIEVSKEFLYRNELKNFMCYSSIKYPEYLIKAIFEVSENKNSYPIENLPEMSKFFNSFFEY